MADDRLPVGMVTFAFTDIEGSTHLLQRLGVGYAPVLESYCAILRDAFAAQGGTEFGAEGDGLFFVFDRPEGAIRGALAGQRGIASHSWPDGVELHVRIGIHSGEVNRTSLGTYVGLALHQAARICAAAHGGQVVVSETTRSMTGAAAGEGIGFSDLGHHRLKDLPDPLHLFQLAHPELRTDFPRLRSDAAPGNLPRQITTFVGREREVAAARQALADGSPLVTLTGPGGAGKTRLALEVAAEIVDTFPHGAWIVELAALIEPDAVAQAISSTIAVRDEPGRTVEQSILAALHDQRLLLVLDNCEHLVEAIADLTAAILRSCPGVQILATSQESLGVLGEVVLAVPPLGRPDAFELFADRAARRRLGFRVDDASREAVEQICDRLDGIPLAIELAAARAAVLSPQQIAARLDDQFRLLTGGARTGLARQRTLRATVDWSHQLLGELERIVFRRLAVFAGGWTLDAAEDVSAGGEIDRAEVLDLLGRLVSRSLVVVDEQDMAARYRFLEPIRQYAQEKLATAGEAGELRTRHRHWFHDLVVAAEPELIGPEQGRWLARIEVEYDNVRAAMEWAVSHPSGGTVLIEMAEALSLYWLVRGHWTEGRSWLHRALAATPGDRSALRARALAAAGDLATEQADYDHALPLLQEALALAGDLGQPETTAKVLNHLGNLARGRSEYDTARAYLAQALAIRRAEGSDRDVAVSLRNLGLLAALQRDFDTARSLFQEALPLARSAGDVRVVATLTSNLATVAFTDGDREQARRLAEEGLTISRSLGDRRAIAEHLTVLVAVAEADGDSAAAASLAEEARSLWRALGGRDTMARFATAMGELAHAAGRLEDALRDLSEALTHWRRLGDGGAVARAAALAGQSALLLGRLDEAEALLRESEELAASMSDEAQRSHALHGLGDVARLRGDLAYAQRLYEQSLELAKQTGWKRLLWGPVQGLGTLTRLRGQPREALDLLAESIALRPALGRRLGTAACLDEAAAALASLGESDAAVRLLAVADRVRAGAGVSAPPVWALERERLVAELRARLGEEPFRLAVKDAAELSLDAAAELVRHR